MKKLVDFIGANLFLLAMLTVGVVVVIALSKTVQLAGIPDEVMVYLYWPIGLAGIFASYYAGKHGARLISRL